MRFLLTTTLTLCAVLGVSGSAETVLYHEDFSRYQPVDSQRVVASGHPEFAHALELQTVLGADGNSKQANWSYSALNTAGAEEVTIDYWIKFGTNAARYALLANDGGSKSITVVQNRQKFQIARSNFHGWADGGSAALNEWHHCRYEVNFIRGDFSFFVNDMTQPRLANMSFRDSRTTGLSKLWILGSEKGESTTFLGPITVTARSSGEFPAPAMGEWPYYVRGVSWTGKPPVNSQDFADLTPIELAAETGAPEEAATAKIKRDAENLYVYFELQAREINRRVNEVTERDGRPWTNDCFEIFLQPDMSQPTYFHLVGNSSGSIYDARHSHGSRDVSWNCAWQAVIDRQDTFWSALVTIPFAGLGGAPAADAIWGFNLGRENPHSRETLSWTKLSNFHTPAKFGKLLFAASDDQRSQEVRTVDLMNRLYDLPGKLQAVDDLLAQCQGASQPHEVLLKQLQNKLRAQRQNVSRARHFPSFRLLLDEVEALSLESEQLWQSIKRYQAYFADGSVARRRGYAGLVFSSMSKVGSHQANTFPVQEKAQLRLSGNEYGSFQVMIQMPAEQTITSLKTNFSPILNAQGKQLAGAKTAVYHEEMIRTAWQLERGQTQMEFADVLRPGDDFTFAPASMAMLWIDVYLPPQTPAGEFNCVLTVTPGNLPPLTVPVTVQATGLTLPKSASLDTAFCFSPSWVKNFYGQAANNEQMLAYCQFLLDHRLEPMNLWTLSDVDIGKDCLDYCAENGKTMLFLSIRDIRNKQEQTRELIEEYRGRLRPIFFGHDEVVASSRPGAIDNMKKDFADAKELFPDVPRLNTAHIDERIFGYVDIWCPLFHYYVADDARPRRELGEAIWWYPTDYPLAPFANFNLDSPGIDPRVIPWMNWKLDITGLLYWGLNREWRSNGTFEAEQLNQSFCRQRGLDWATPEIIAQMKAGEIRWPQIPWLPYFRSINNVNSVSRTNGGGNLMYPGENFQPLASIRLKNLRDGMQDYEYFVMLRQQVNKLKERGGHQGLVREAEAALAIDDQVVGGADSFTKDPAELLAFRDKIIDLILKIQTP